MIILANNPEFYKFTIHIDLKFYRVWEVIEQGISSLKFLLTQFMAINKLTKPLFSKKF